MAVRPNGGEKQDKAIFLYNPQEKQDFHPLSSRRNPWGNGLFWLSLSP
jgi:hypothetical protein